MLTKFVKLAAIAALLVTVILWKHAQSFDLEVRFIVALSAFMVATQAVRARKHYWAAGFFALAILFNPFVAIITASGTLSLVVILATVAPFAFSLIALKTQPLLSMPSITGDTPGSESL